MAAILRKLLPTSRNAVATWAIVIGGALGAILAEGIWWARDGQGQVPGLLNYPLIAFGSVVLHLLLVRIAKRRAHKIYPLEFQRAVDKHLDQAFAKWRDGDFHIFEPMSDTLLEEAAVETIASYLKNHRHDRR